MYLHRLNKLTMVAQLWHAGCFTYQNRQVSPGFSGFLPHFTTSLPCGTRSLCREQLHLALIPLILLAFWVLQYTLHTALVCTDLKPCLLYYKLVNCYLVWHLGHIGTFTQCRYPCFVPALYFNWSYSSLC